VTLCIAIWLGKFRIGTRGLHVRFRSPTPSNFLDYAVLLPDADVPAVEDPPALDSDVV
jgi:hypothetical protein